jgi:hypothetical protein
VGISSNDRIEVIDDSLDVPPLLSPGHIPDTVFELLNGARSDAKAEASKVKPQELEALVRRVFVSWSESLSFPRTSLA